MSKKPLPKVRGGLSGAAARASALREAWALAALPSCDNLLRYFSSWHEQDHLFIQTELCDGTLEQHKTLSAIWLSLIHI